ncbi:MAG: AAA family ATPase, partial [Eubacteriales bacterium]|nr:AAA family ATPase [Eubacteriales bacterium]
MAKILSFLNQNGGVGKTTTFLNLGAALALNGKSVIVVDA